MIDIDKFKNINDTYGHDVGDIIIIALANEVKKDLRPTDIFARFGGEEFVLMFPNTSLEEVIEISEKIRIRIEQSIPHEIIRYTISTGVAQFDLENDDVNDVIKRADNGLYKAKENGRNQVQSDIIMCQKEQKVVIY